MNPPPSSAGRTVKLVLPSGQALDAEVARALPKTEDGPLRLVTGPLEGGPLYDGLTGEARVYGRRVPLAFEYLVRPVERFFQSDLWSAL